MAAHVYQSPGWATLQDASHETSNKIPKCQRGGSGLQCLPRVHKVPFQHHQKRKQREKTIISVDLHPKSLHREPLIISISALSIPAFHSITQKYQVPWFLLKCKRSKAGQEPSKGIWSLKTICSSLFSHYPAAGSDTEWVPLTPQSVQLL